MEGTNEEGGVLPTYTHRHSNGTLRFTDDAMLDARCSMPLALAICLTNLDFKLGKVHGISLSLLADGTSCLFILFRSS